MDSAATWDVYDGVGRYLAEAAPPAWLQVHAIQRDAAWGVARGSFGVRQLVAYALKRGAAGG